MPCGIKYWDIYNKFLCYKLTGKKKTAKTREAMEEYENSMVCKQKSRQMKGRKSKYIKIKKM